jgi:large subunit ribosomal protein L40
MAHACETLRLIDTNGLTAEERLKIGEGVAEGNQVGKLYRLAMKKTGIWGGVPIEYARIQTETPPKDGWNHGWTR